MSLKKQLEDEVAKTFKDEWTQVVTTSVPKPEDLVLNGNYAKKIESATVLYADLDGSTDMVAKYTYWFSAEIYKTYLRCASQIIKNEGGTITAYDGDRVMAIFVGNGKNTSAVKAAMKINYAVINIIRPAIKKAYPTTEFTLNHVIGVDSSEINAARIGVRGDNDIVWVGKAANYAAKLCNQSGKPIWITERVYNLMKDEVKISSGVNMWTYRVWPEGGDIKIFGTTYHWTLT